MGIFRAIMRQQQRAAAAKGCMTLIVFIFLVIVTLVFGVPILVHLLAFAHKHP